MSSPLEDALKAVSRLRGDPSFDASAWRDLRELVDKLRPPPASNAERDAEGQ